MKLISRRLTLLFSVLFICSVNFAQLSVNNGFTAQQLGNNLAGNNVNVFNATISGDPVQYGTFNYVGTDLGLNFGVILSTGDIFDAVGPNSSGATSSTIGGPGDPDLSNLAGFNTNDAVVFEFDFEVQGDEIEFNFVFMSEEYNEFVNSGFNDVFAFYISGPGIVGQENLAIVPGTTTPVTINTINNDSFWQFYNDNDNGAVNIEFDGFMTYVKKPFFDEETSLQVSSYTFENEPKGLVCVREENTSLIINEALCDISQLNVDELYKGRMKKF